MMTGDQYRSSLKDGRRIYFRGQRVDDVTTHPTFAQQVDAAAVGYDKIYDPDPNGLSQLMEAPRSIEALRRQTEDEPDLLSGISCTSAMTLLTAADRLDARRPQGADNIRAYVKDIQRRDLRIVECITDAKGDRTLAPAKQADPDAYLRVIERRTDGVVIRGCKLHIAQAPIAHELMVIPTKSMKPDEGDYSIACGVAVDTPGVKIVNAGTLPSDVDRRDYPFADAHFCSHGFVIFDDVFVPNERIFLDGEADLSAAFAHSLGTWTRVRGLARMIDEADIMAGFASLIADANGLEKVAHIREKITDMAIHATVLRALLEAALSNARTLPSGMVAPDELYISTGKWIGASERALMTRHLQDIAGGSLLTAPSRADLDNPETGDLVRKYMVGAAAYDGEYRLKLFHALKDLTVSATGVYRSIASLTAGGGLFAQRVVLRNRYDIGRARRMALESVGMEREG